jgi:NAD(P)-dependent dehydrogenase (short-subunit alcohol dehydrogenase family)
MGLLDGKVAAVTGAGHGIGRGEAIELAAQGAAVVVNDLGGGVDGTGAPTTVADDVVAVITARGGRAVAHHDDISTWAGAQSLVETAVREFGGLDVVVNNAGILRDRLIVQMSEDDWDSVIRVHLKGTFTCTKHAMDYWRAESKVGRQRRAAVVNTVSSAGLQGNPGQANYGAAKAGIAALTIITSLEGARIGVRANAIAPGGMTRIVATIRDDVALKEPEEYEGYDRMNPGNSAPMVAWLASDEALHVTGQVFRAVGNTISRYDPWAIGATVTATDRAGNAARWDPAAIGPAVNARIFHSRHPGLQMEM